MATFLYRVGRFSYRRRGLVAGVWLLLLVATGIAAATLSGPTSSTFSIPGTESQKALDLITERNPGANADGASVRVVFVAGGNGTLTSDASKAAVEKAITQLKAVDDVAAVSDPYRSQAVSQDGTTAYATVSYSVPATQLTSATNETLQTAARSAVGPGITVEFGGDVVSSDGPAGATEGIGIVIGAIVLVITFGSLLAAGLPLLTALIGVGFGTLGVAVATGFTDISDTTSVLATMLGLAVGIDYALFIVSRYRHELLVGRDGEEAAGRAIGTAGSAVVFAGATVVIALAALLVAGIPFLSSMGLAAAGTVAMAVVIALTLVPALLGFLGRRVLGRRGRAALDPEAPGGGDGNLVHGEPMGARWARLVVRGRVPVFIVLVLALGAIALPTLDLRLGMPTDETASPSTTQRRAYDALAAGFGPGFNGPLIVAVDLAGITGEDSGFARDAATTDIQADLAKVPGVAAVAPATPNAAGDLALITVIPTTGPSTDATETLVHTIRADAQKWRAERGARAYVTGTTAIGIDISEKLGAALAPYLIVVVGLAFLLLMLVFRSLVVPLKATLGFLLSLAATFGALVAVFQKSWGAGLVGLDSSGPILSFLPILVIGILFGLAMDYEVFLVTRMREEFVHGADAQSAVVSGFRHGARVVTAAAVIMTSVFAGFVITDDPIVKSIGFALSVGIVFDAFVVRMTLVPAIMSLLGRSAWWFPSWLDRLLPDVDVEGEGLTAALATAQTPSARVPAQGSLSEADAATHSSSN
ncbi:MMPL family transporter [Spongisporangium articulatum]|uniref:MMPL family transporter n=1 Tax=Spongisporangium articulatum TaxID=3362603 RepID=A0ABW8AGN4_9ACTN